jgi:hypothetical protein
MAVCAQRDTNGTLDMAELEELRVALKFLHPDLYPWPLTPAIADQVVGSALDTDGDGVISRTEWLNFVIEMARKHSEKAMLKLMQVLSKELAKKWKPA